MKSIEFNIFKADQPKLKPIKGRVLIAEPFLPGPYFNRSIILLTECNKEGAMGFVLNKSSDLYPDEVIDDLFSFKGELYLGGPVSSDTLFFVHRLGDRVPGSVKITGDLYWGGDFEVIKELINNDEATYQDVKFFAGYSGWGAGQLEEEIEENSWIVAKLDDAVVLDPNVDHIWEDTMSQLGDVYKAWTNFPENPSFN